MVPWLDLCDVLSALPSLPPVNRTRWPTKACRIKAHRVLLHPLTILCGPLHRTPIITGRDALISLFTSAYHRAQSAKVASVMDDDDDLIVKGLPQLLSTICVTISRWYMLEEAVRRICGTLHAFELTDSDDNTVMASVKIDLPSHSKDISLNQQIFYGESNQLGTDAIESTCSAPLAYLLLLLF